MLKTLEIKKQRYFNVSV